MRTSETTAELATALRDAQAQFPTIPKVHTAHVVPKSGAPPYTYQYADLADIVTAARPVLTAHYLVVTQVVEHDDVDLLTTRLTHTETGEFIEGSMRLFEASSPQAQGSSITYARRYAYCALLGIVADEDDDGAAAQHSQRPSGARRTSAVEDAFPGAEPLDAPPWEPPTSATPTATGIGVVNEKMNKRIYALCASNDLNAAAEASRILGHRIGDTRLLTKEQAKQVLDALTAEGVSFPN